MSREFVIQGENFYVSDEREKYSVLKKKFKDTGGEYLKLSNNVVMLDNLKKFAKNKSDKDNFKILLDVCNTIRGVIDRLIKTEAIPLLFEYNIYHIDEKIFYDDYMSNSKWNNTIYQIGEEWHSGNISDVYEWCNKVVTQIMLNSNNYLDDVLYAAIKVLDEEGAEIDFLPVSKNDAKKACIIADNLSSSRIPENRRGKAIVEALQLNPHEESIYTAPYLYFEKELAREIGEVAGFFQIEEKIFSEVMFHELRWYKAQLEKDKTLNEQELTWNTGTNLVKNVCYGFKIDEFTYIEDVNKSYYKKKAELLLLLACDNKDDREMIEALFEEIKSINCQEIKEEYVSLFEKMMFSIEYELLLKEYKGIDKNDINSYEELRNKCKKIKGIMPNDELLNKIEKSIRDAKSKKKEDDEKKERDEVIEFIEMKMSKVNFDDFASVKYFKKLVEIKHKARGDSLLEPYLDKANKAMRVISDTKILRNAYFNSKKTKVELEKFISYASEFADNEVAKDLIFAAKEDIRKINNSNKESFKGYTSNEQMKENCVLENDKDCKHKLSSKTGATNRNGGLSISDFDNLFNNYIFQVKKDGGGSFYSLENLDKGKIANFCKKCDKKFNKSPVFKEIVAYYDSTMFGKGNEGIVVALDGVYYLDEKDDKYLYIAYCDMKKLAVYDSGMFTNKAVIDYQGKTIKMNMYSDGTSEIRRELVNIINCIRERVN